MLTGEHRSTVERSRTVQWLGMTPISSRIKIEKLLEVMQWAGMTLLSPQD